MSLKIIDSTTLPLNLTHYKWARFRKAKADVKLHLQLVFIDKDNVYPDKAIMITADEHDRNQLEVLIDDKVAMYIFDRGHVDYERFNRRTDDVTFFASRLKKNSVTRTVQSFDLPEIHLSSVMKWSILAQLKIEQKTSSNSWKSKIQKEMYYALSQIDLIYPLMKSVIFIVFVG